MNELFTNLLSEYSSSGTEDKEKMIGKLPKDINNELISLTKIDDDYKDYQNVVAYRLGKVYDYFGNIADQLKQKLNIINLEAWAKTWQPTAWTSAVCCMEGMDDCWTQDVRDAVARDDLKE